MHNDLGVLISGVVLYASLCKYIYKVTALAIYSHLWVHTTSALDVNSIKFVCMFQ